MEKARVVLRTETCGETEKFEGVGEYSYNGKNFEIKFQADGALFRLINKDGLILIREGEINYLFDFKKNTRKSGVIKTPYGEIRAEICAENVRVECNADYAIVFVKYFLIMAGEKTKHTTSISAVKIKNGVKI